MKLIVLNMTKRIAFLLIGMSLYLSILGQEWVGNTISGLQQYSSQEKNISRHYLINKIEPLSFTSGSAYKEKLDSIIEYNYNDASGAWDIKFVKDSYIYDENYNESLWVYSSWSGKNNRWENLMQEKTDYDDQGKLIGFTSYVWANGQWNSVSKREYIYGDDNEVIQELRYAWKYNLNDWLKVEKWAYEYDDEGRSLKDSCYWWREPSQDWELQEKNDYSYIEGKLHYIIGSKWDNATTQWRYSEKKWYLYDNIKWKLNSLSSYEWYDAINNWKLVSHKVFGYDDGDFEDYMIGYGVLSRDLDSDAWKKHLSELYIVNYSINSQELVLPYFLKTNEFFFYHKVVSKKQSTTDLAINEKKQYRQVEYYYSPVGDVNTSARYKINQEEVNVYPNPARGSVTINFSTSYGHGLFELLAINGKKILSTTCMNGDHINISSIKPGIYFYQVTLDEKVESGKLVIN